MPQISKLQIIEQIHGLGIEKGDTIFVSADLMKTGYFNKNAETTFRDWVDIFDEILGGDGTIVIPTYSPAFLRYFEKYDFVFTPESESNSGSLAKAFLNYAPDLIRGKHPTNSCASRGRHAAHIASMDGPDFPKYQPYAEVVKLGGKNLMLGTIDERNCPFTYHHVQESLGHTKSHPFCGLLETTYLDEGGEKKKYIVREIGGCTRGVHKSWGHHLAKSAVNFGMVGRHLSAVVDAQSSTEVLTKVMTETPHLMQCDDTTCISCRGRFRYNGWGVVAYYPQRVPALFRKVMGRVIR